LSGTRRVYGNIKLTRILSGIYADQASNYGGLSQTAISFHLQCGCFEEAALQHKTNEIKRRTKTEKERTKLEMENEKEARTIYTVHG